MFESRIYSSNVTTVGLYNNERYKAHMEALQFQPAVSRVPHNLMTNASVGKQEKTPRLQLCTQM